MSTDVSDVMWRKFQKQKDYKVSTLIYNCVYWQFIGSLQQVFINTENCRWTQAGAAIWDIWTH